MVNTNRFTGLFRGPIDNKATSVITSISNGAIDMGSVVKLDTTALTTNNEILPRVEQSTTTGDTLVYGIVVGGDADGVYGDGSTSTDDSTRASTGAGQGVDVVTQGRCLAKVSGGAGPILIGSKLTQSNVTGQLRLAAATHTVIATALNSVLGADTDMIAVDVQREGAIET